MFDPDREVLFERVSSVAAMLAVLVFGVAIGATWVGWEVQALGCVTKFGIGGACSALPAVERQTNWLIALFICLIVVSFAAEWYRQQIENRGQRT